MADSWGDYWERRVENVKEQVHITDVLEHYGIRVRTVEREFQYPCPLHGDGQDNSFSARMYPEASNDDPSGGTYCFACQKARDLIEWVKDAEGLSFKGAVSHIERTFGVTDKPTPYIEADDYEERRSKVFGVEEGGRTIQDDFEAMERQARKTIANHRKAFSAEGAAKIYFVLDNLRFDVDNDNVTERKARQVLEKLATRLEGYGKH